WGVAAPPRVLDPVEVLNRVGGDRRLLRQLVAMFAVECPRLMEEIRTALSGEDAVRVRRAAHTLKGAVATLGGTAAFEQAVQLETEAREGNLSKGREVYRAL